MEKIMTYSEFEWQTSDGILLSAYRWAPEEPQGNVCLVHGLGEHSARYAHVANLLNQAKYTFVAFDLRGHGQSQGPRGHSPSLEHLYEDITTLIDKLKSENPDLPTFLYGHSLGGMLVLGYAARLSPDLAGIISTGPLLRPGFEPPAWKLPLGRLMRSLMPTFSMSNELDRPGLSRDAEVVHAYNTDPLVHDRISAQLGVDMLEEGLWLLRNVPTLKIPTLLMHGSLDRICSPEGSRQYAETAGELMTLKMWEGLYHEIHNEPEKDQVIQYLIQWLNERI
jgi:acylglycerol lipase